MRVASEDMNRCSEELYHPSAMANASRVSEIFQQASAAFGRLAYLTLELKLSQAQQNTSDQKSNTKWTTEEINELKAAIVRFGNDLEKIAQSIETKTLDQIKQKVHSKTFQTTGLDQRKNAPGTTEPVQRRRSPSDSNIDLGMPAKRSRTEEELSASKQPTCKQDNISSNEVCPPVSTGSGSLNAGIQRPFTSLPVDTDNKNQKFIGSNSNTPNTKIESSSGSLRPTAVTIENSESHYEEYEDSSDDGENEGSYESGVLSDADGEDDEEAAADAV
ncbi:chromatin complexes subunit BAP18 [Clonorchis sinensis]|uniref:Chromatin complexes subunit BAP18 n=1 Tax=Clonorchis sinensis TaxID=79923 RepID=H2KQZ9_CLOSI|nr:chromatin complexes subunit BAP18 [Clonorchis sinensis]